MTVLTDNDKINGLPIRTEIRIPRDGDTGRWLSSVVICQDTRKGTFVVWSVWQEGGAVQADNGRYDIDEYGRAITLAVARARAAFE